MDEITRSLTTIAVAITGIALLAVLVSKNANTSGVLSAGGSAFATALTAAEGPVSGSSLSLSANSFEMPTNQLGANGY